MSIFFSIVASHAGGHWDYTKADHRTLVSKLMAGSHTGDDKTVVICKLTDGFDEDLTNELPDEYDDEDMINPMLDEDREVPDPSENCSLDFSYVLYGRVYR